MPSVGPFAEESANYKSDEASNGRLSEAGAHGRHAHAAELKRAREAALIKAVVSGDPQAQKSFIAKYGRLIYHVIRQMGVREHMIDDIYQTIFVNLWDRDCRRLRQWSGKGVFTSYLCTVVRRIAYDELRRIAADVAVEPIDESVEAEALTSEGPEAILEQRYYASAVSRVMSKLKPSDARLIMFRHIDDLSYSEIGSKLDMSVNHVGVALFRGVRRMRQMLEAELS